MTDRRAAILNGRKAATELHRDLKIRAEAELTGQLDVFETLVRLGIPCICRPLNALLGAYLPPPHHGVLITTERSRAIQRFTAAHELGHAYLTHRASYDDESVIARATIRPYDFDLQEVEADAFAGAFLAPQWLVLRHIKRQGWTAADLRSPRNVYQLSLRLGMTFNSTAVSLVQNAVLTWTDYAALGIDRVKAIKQEIGGKNALPDWNKDVWRLREQDNGEKVLCGPGDLVIVDVEERAGAGYLWIPDSVGIQPFDESSTFDETTVGGPSTRHLRYWVSDEDDAAIALAHRRPWAEAADDSFNAVLQVCPREQGYTRSARVRLAA